MLWSETKLRILAAMSLLAGTVTLQAQQPMMQPPSPPQVTYNGGQLSVTANNSTIADVVNAINNALGIKTEGVLPASTDRIFGHFGPASPSTVLGAVLSGSPYDFIIVGSNDETGPVQQIILSPRSSVHVTQSNSTPAPVNNASNNNNNGVVTDPFSYNDPQYSVPQYKYVPPTGTNNGQPGQFGQNGQMNQAGQNGQNGQPGDQRSMPYHPQHYGALYGPNNPPPQNPNAMNPNAANQQSQSQSQSQ